MTAASCPANIGPRGQAQRFAAGCLLVGAGVLLGFMLVFLHAPRLSRALISPFFFMAALCFLQARAQVCVLYAAQGVTHFDGGVKPDPDAGRKAAVRKAARKILLLSGVLSLSATLAAFLF